MAGAVYGIAMDKWVNDLDDETVRARYLTGNADIQEHTVADDARYICWDLGY